MRAQSSAPESTRARARPDGAASLFALCAACVCARAVQCVHLRTMHEVYIDYICVLNSIYCICGVPSIYIYMRADPNSLKGNLSKTIITENAPP